MILTMTGGELPECMTPGEEKRKASFFFSQIIGKQELIEKFA